MSEYLTGELLISILIRVPVSSLVRFTEVCKEWRELIKSAYFISVHLDYVLSNSSPVAFLKHHSASPKLDRFFINFEPDSAVNFTFRFQNYDADFQSPDVIGCVHGLICLTDFKRSLNFVWNPIVRKFIQFQDQESSRGQINLTRDLGFGYDCKRKDYKIVRISIIKNIESIFPETKASVYAIKERFWRDLNSDDILNHCCLKKGAVFCERLALLHWIASSGWKKFIICFDLIRENFGKMRLPECLEEVSVLVGYLFLGEICGSLAVIHAKQKEYKVFEGIDVWVGKDCGWNKVYVVGDAITGTLGSLIGLSGSGSGLLLAIGCKESDERELVQFDLKSNRTKKLGITSAMGAIYAGSYIDSLLLFNDDSGAISFQEIEPKEL